MTNETRSANVMVRMAPTLKAAAEKAAADDTRSLSSLIERLLIEFLRGRGYLKRPEVDDGNLPGHTTDPNEADRKPR